MHLTFKTIAIVALAILLFAGSARADVQVIETVRVSEAPDMGGAKAGRITTWIGENRFARVDELNGITTVIRKDTNKMMIIDQDAEEVIEIDLPFALPEHLLPIFQEMQMDWDLNRFPERQKIRDWDCSKVLITGRGPLKIDIELWVTADTIINTRMYNSLVGETLRASAIYRDMADKLFGIAPSFAIRTQTTIEQIGLRVTTEAEVISIRQVEAPDEVFSAPEGYAVKNLDFASYLSLVQERQPRLGGQ